MAYNPGIEQDDEQQAQGADDAGTNQLAGGSGVISGQTSGQAQKQKGSGFVNIGQYLGANQQDLAGQTDKAISKVNEGWGSASDKIAQSKAGFDTAADQNRVTLGDASTTEDDKQFASTFLKDSNLGEEDAGKFASWQNMSYQGPTEIQDTWSADQKKSDDLASTISNANGYFPAMNEIFGNGRSDYTAGSQRLDASLMAADKTGQERINQNTAQQQQALSSSIQAAQSEAANKAKQYQTEAQSGKDAAWEALNEYMPSYATGLADQLATKNAQRQAEFDAAKQGGGTTQVGWIQNNMPAQQSAAYDELKNRIEQQYYTNKGLGISDSRAEAARDRALNLLNSWAYTPADQLEYRFTDPRRADYVTQGERLGLGSLDDGTRAKLDALYSLSGDVGTRDAIESQIASKLGFEDIGRDGRGDAYTFDERSYNEALDAARNAEINRTRDIEAQNAQRYYEQQQQLLDSWLSGKLDRSFYN